VKLFGLIDIRRKYTATCFDLRIVVENGAEGWKAQIFQSKNGQELHSATRCNLRNAKLAAAEYAVARMTGALDAATVRIMADNLTWAESW
jgi:hypothetical protein